MFSRKLFEVAHCSIKYWNTVIHVRNFDWYLSTTTKEIKRETEKKFIVALLRTILYLQCHSHFDYFLFDFIFYDNKMKEAKKKTRNEIKPSNIEIKKK